MKKNIKIINIVIIMLLIFVISCSGAAKDKELYYEGMDYLNNYLSPYAIESFKEVIIRYPDSIYAPKSIEGIMSIYYMFENPSKVIDFYKEHENLINDHKDRDILSVELIYSYVIASYYDLAKYSEVLNYSDYIGLFSEDINQDTLLYMAAASMQLGKLSLYEKYANDISNRFYRVGLGFILFRNEEIELAFDNFDYFLNNIERKELVQQDTAYALYNLGNVYINYNRGIEIHNYLNPLLKEISYKKENIDIVLFILGRVEMQSELNNYALKRFENIIKYYPDSDFLEDSKQHIVEIQNEINN